MSQRKNSEVESAETAAEVAAETPTTIGEVLRQAESPEQAAAIDAILDSVMSDAGESSAEGAATIAAAPGETAAEVAVADDNSPVKVIGTFDKRETADAAASLTGVNAFVKPFNGRFRVYERIAVTRAPAAATQMSGAVKVVGNLPTEESAAERVKEIGEKAFYKPYAGAFRVYERV